MSFGLVFRSAFDRVLATWLFRTTPVPLVGGSDVKSHSTTGGEVIDES